MNNSQTLPPGNSLKTMRLVCLGLAALIVLVLLYRAVHSLDYEARLRFWEKFMVEGHAAMRDRRLQHALDSFRQAVEESSRFAQPDIRLAISQSDLAGSERLYGKLADSERHYRQSIEIYAALERKSAGQDAAAQFIPCEKARAYCGLGNVFLMERKYPEAEKSFEAALTLYRAEGEKCKTDPLLRQDLVAALAGMAESAFAQKRFEKAEPFYVAAAALIDKCVGTDPLKRTIMSGYSKVLLFTGRPHAAHAAEAAGRITGSEKRLQSLVDEGRAALIKRHFGEAERALKMAQDEADTVDLGEPFVVPLRMLAQLYVQTGRLSEAEEACERALQLTSQSDGVVDDEIDKTLKQLVYIYIARGEYARALPLLERQLELEKTTYSTSGHRIAETLAIQAYASDRAGQKAEAEKLIGDALSSLSTAREMPRAATAYTYLGKIYFAHGGLPQAQEMFEKALAIREKTRSAKSAKAAEARKDLALVQMARGEFATANAELVKAIELMRIKCEADDPLWISVYGAYGRCLEKMGKEREAEAAYRDAFDGIAKNNFIHGEESVQAATAYASLLRRINKTDELARVESYVVRNN